MDKDKVRNSSMNRDANRGKTPVATRDKTVKDLGGEPIRSQPKPKPKGKEKR